MLPRACDRLCVLVMQAFHWFANTGSLREFRRVLKPEGLLVLIWNLEDGSTPWVHSLRTLYEQHEQGSPQFRYACIHLNFSCP